MCFVFFQIQIFKVTIMRYSSYKSFHLAITEAVINVGLELARIFGFYFRLRESDASF